MAQNDYKQIFNHFINENNSISTKIMAIVCQMKILAENEKKNFQLSGIYIYFFNTKISLEF